MTDTENIDEAPRPRWHKLVFGAILFPTWTGLKRLGASPIMKATVLVPVLGYVILISDQVTFRGTFWIEFSGEAVDVGWVPLIGGLLMWVEPYRLYLLYFALTGLGVGSLLYGWLCPHEVRDYTDRIDYIRSRIEHTTLARRQGFLSYAMHAVDATRLLTTINTRRVLRDRLRQVCETSLNQLVGSPEHTGYAALRAWFLATYIRKCIEVSPTHDVDEMELFTDLCSRTHQLYNQSLPLARLAIRVLWTTGFVLLALPSFYALLAVITVVFSDVPA